MAQNAQKGQRFRVVGSGYTLFSYSGSRIKFARQIQETAPRPVGTGPQAVQPIDARHPIEIAFPSAVTAGSLVVTIIEEWDRDVWRQFPGFRNNQYSDLADVFDRNIRLGGVTCVKVIKPPAGIGRKRRMVMYHNAVITDIDMNENVTIESMTVGRAVTITYTHRTIRGG